MTTTPAVYHRTTIEAEATLSGLLDAVAQMAQIAPPHAEIVDIANYFGCPDEALEAEAAGIDAPEHDPVQYLAFTIEWTPEEGS